MNRESSIKQNDSNDQEKFLKQAFHDLRELNAIFDPIMSNRWLNKSQDYTYVDAD